MVVKIWGFSTHYMIRCSNGDKSYGWRVEKSLTEDSEVSERIARLVAKVKMEVL